MTEKYNRRGGRSNWVSNTFDPRRPRDEVILSIAFSFEAMRDQHLRELEIKQHFEWVNKFHIGPPSASKTYTVRQLESMGMVGLYRKPVHGLIGKDAVKFMKDILSGKLSRLSKRNKKKKK